MSDLTPEQASEVAAHKARSAQMAVEVSREVHLEDTIQRTAEQTKKALLEGLEEVFGKGGDDIGTGDYNILMRRIPLICQDVKQIHTDMSSMSTDIKGINANISRGVWIILGGVITAILKLILIP